MLKHRTAVGILWLFLVSLVLSSFLIPPKASNIASSIITRFVFFRTRKCSKYYYHDHFGDGFGNQLLDLASLMVYHLVNSEQMCYLGRQYELDRDDQFGHGCTTCAILYNELNRGWPSLESAPIGAVIIPATNDFWRKILNECGEPRSKLRHNKRCDIARRKVGKRFANVAGKLAQSRGVPRLDLAIHSIRKGDFPRKLSTAYGEVIDHHFPGAKLDVFTEFGNESNEILSQLNSTHQLVLHEGGDALESWLLMANAKVLFVRQSSYSISASVGSRGIVFSQRKEPYRGRYDGNIFTCPTVADWWISYGHGRTTCHDEELKQVEKLLQSQPLNIAIY